MIRCRAWSGPALPLARTICERIYRHFSSETNYAPVLICGAGPSGLVLSRLLSLYGVQHIVLERGEQLTQHPQAHFINNRTMEVFRGLGPLAAQVAALSPLLSEWRKFVYCQSMAGALIGEVDHFPGQAQPRTPSLSPEGLAHLSQHKLLPLLLDLALHSSWCSRGEVRWSRRVQHVALPALNPGNTISSAAGTTGSTTSSSSSTSTSSSSSRSSSSSGSGNSSGRGGRGVQEQQLVTVGAVHQATGVYEQYRCNYLVAADGAHSTIRQVLGIPMSGSPALQHLINIHFTSKQLGQQMLTGPRGGQEDQGRGDKGQGQGVGRPAMLYFVFNRDVVAVVVAHDLQQGEFVAQVPYFPPQQSPSQFSEAVCRELVSSAAGVDLPDLDIRTVRPWTMSALVADRYSEGPAHRVLLVGDAAHRFPPAGGFGMNTGIQDAHNLAWKLAAVLSGGAGPGLLATYGAERRPVGVANTELSVRNWHEAVRVPAALGLSPGAAQVLHQVVGAAPLPGPLGKVLLEAGLAAGRTLASLGLPFSKTAVTHILQAGDSLRLQFPREDLGFRYSGEGAAVAASSYWRVTEDGRRVLLRNSSSSSSSGGFSTAFQKAKGEEDGCSSSSSSSSGWSFGSSAGSSSSSSGLSRSSSSSSSSRGLSGRGAPYVPSTSEGSRLPHVPLLLLVWGEGEGEQRQVVSTLDLVAPLNGNHWLIITSSSSGGSSTSTSSNGRSVASSGSTSSNGRSIDGSSSSGGDVGRCGSSFWMDVGQRLQQAAWPVNLLEILGRGEEDQTGGVAAGGGEWEEAVGAAAGGEGGGGAVEAQTSGQQQRVWHAVDISGVWQELHKELPMSPPLAAPGNTATATGAVAELVVLVRPDGHVAWRGLGVGDSGVKQQGSDAMPLENRGMGAADASSGESDDTVSCLDVDAAVQFMGGLMKKLLYLQ